MEWVCDGVKDCPLGDDESQPECCLMCKSNEFLCSYPHQCIPLYEECNGYSDCGDSSDESFCFSLSNTGVTSDGVTTHLVNANFTGVSGYYICSDNWNQSWSDSVCKYLGYGQSTATAYEPVNGPFLTLASTNSSSNLISYFHRTLSCQSQTAVAINCSQSDCGIRTVPADSVGPYILNGQIAARGAWPWQAAVHFGNFSNSGEFNVLQFSEIGFCGGILINERWILTAGHCTNVTDPGLGYLGTLKSANALVVLGTTNLNEPNDPDAIASKVDMIFTDPSFAQDPNGPVFDAGLMRLAEPVTFSDTVRPICLPSANVDLSQFRVCVDTGFGETLLGVPSPVLLQARMNPMTYEDCYNYITNGGLIDLTLKYSTDLCVGTVPTLGDNNICSGDSGGPFACEGQNGVWTVIGINSFSLSQFNTNNATVAEKCQLSVVARVTAFLGWIQSTIASNIV